MKRSYLGSLLLLFLCLGAINGLAQDEDVVRSAVDYKINKMQKALKLTDTQISAIHPIIKDYLNKRDAFLKEIAAQGIVDHVAVKATLKTLKDNEYKKLSQILSPDQMQQWIDKENLLAALNPDSSVSTVDDDGPTLTGTGADFKF